MKRFMLVLAALAALGLTTSVASAEAAPSEGASLQTAVLHQGNGAQVDEVRWGHRAGWGWGGWYGSGYWPYYSYYRPYYGGYYSPYSAYYGYSYPYYSYSYYPYSTSYGWGCCY